MGAHRCCKTPRFNICHEGDAFVALPSLPAPRCRARQPEIESLAPRLSNQDSLPGWSMQQAVHSRGSSPLGGAAWAHHNTRSVRSYRAAGVLSNPRICAVAQKRRRRGGHLPQGRVGGQLVIRTRLGGVGRCRRRGQMWPDSTVASLSAAASRRRRSRMSITPVDLELIVSKFALETVPQDQHAARSMRSHEATSESFFPTVLRVITCDHIVSRCSQ